MSMNKLPYSFANYPLSFRGCKVSPTKICLQFNDPQIKLRLHGEGTELPKHHKNNERYVAVTTGGIDISSTNIGCQMPVVEDYQLQLIKAYEEYYKNHKDKYKETYGKDFKDFCLQLQVRVNELISIIDQKGDI